LKKGRKQKSNAGNHNAHVLSHTGGSLDATESVWPEKLGHTGQRGKKENRQTHRERSTNNEEERAICVTW